MFWHVPVDILDIKYGVFNLILHCFQKIIQPLFIFLLDLIFESKYPDKWQIWDLSAIPNVAANKAKKALLLCAILPPPPPKGCKHLLSSPIHYIYSHQ